MLALPVYFYLLFDVTHQLNELIGRNVRVLFFSFMIRANFYHIFNAIFFKLYFGSKQGI